MRFADLSMFYRFSGPLAWFLHHLDRPINRFIMDMLSYSLFLLFLLVSVISQLRYDKAGEIGHNGGQKLSWFTYILFCWVTCFFARDLNHMFSMMSNRRLTIMDTRVFYDFIMDLLFIAAIAVKVSFYFFTFI